MNKQKHLTQESRFIIEKELLNHNSFKGIARLLGKDCTTISKEIRNHICFEKTGGFGRCFNDCKHAVAHNCHNLKICSDCSTPKRNCWSCGKCNNTCVLYEKYVCPKLSKPPYVCNGCEDRGKCALEKHLYKATYAQKEYEEVRSESRSGLDISEDELKHLDSVVSPLLINGQSLHHIAIHHADETMLSERTMYTYVNNNLFTARNIDMPRTVRMRPRKSQPKHIKIDKACRIDRSYDDFLTFTAENPELPICQLDSVEGVKGHSVLLTLHFPKQELQLAFKREANDSQSVIDIFDKLYLELRADLFIDVFPVLLADNGSEFSNPKAIEFDKQGHRRCFMFYCDPSAPYQKGHCENNHEMIRRIIPKGTNIDQYTQEQIDLMMSHINSYARKNIGNKSPYDVFAFQFGEDLLNAFNQQHIPADKIILTPKLLATINN